MNNYANSNFKLKSFIRREGFYIWLMLPLIILFSVLYLYPVFMSFWLSFMNYNLTQLSSSIEFVGLQNFIQLFTYDAFIVGFKNTALFVAITVTAEMLIGVGIALLLNREFKGKGIMRIILILPIMFSPIIVGYEWRWLYNDTYGLINYVLQAIGVIDGRIAWLSNPDYALSAIMVADIWFTTPLIILIVLGGLQSMPTDPFESASIDGANMWQKFRYLTLPFIAPAVQAALLLRLMEAFMVFDLPFILTKGGPGITTETVNLFTYKQAFQFFNLGIGAAASVLLLIVIVIVSVLTLKLFSFMIQKGSR